MDFGLSYRRVAALALFAAAMLAAERINFSPIVGQAGQSFTATQFFAPTIAAFLGFGLGLAALAVSQVANFVILGKAASAVSVLRLATPLFAAHYFATAQNETRNPANILVPIAAIAVFLSVPAGFSAWYYSLYWLIPVCVSVFGLGKNLFARSLGATFTAHAVGSAIWSLSVPMTAAQWTSLVFVTAVERISFAAGISLAYVAASAATAYASKRIDISPVRFEKRYAAIVARPLW